MWQQKKGGDEEGGFLEAWRVTRANEEESDGRGRRGTMGRTHSVGDTKDLHLERGDRGGRRAQFFTSEGGGRIQEKHMYGTI